MINLIEKLKEIPKKNELRRSRIDSLFTTDFIKKFQTFIYTGKYLDELIDDHKLFHTFDDKFNIRKIFEERNDIKDIENKRYNNNSLHKVFYFNPPYNSDNPVRVNLVIKNKGITNILKKRFNKLNIEAVVDIEFFELIPIENDSKNNEIKEFIYEYLYSDSTITLDDIDSIGKIKALRDIEKFHMTFMVDDKKNIHLIFLGIGANEPFTMSSKTKYGKERYYRYSVNDINTFEQTSGITKTKTKFPPEHLISSECTTDGNEYWLESNNGIFLKNGGTWYKPSYHSIYKDISKQMNIDALKFIEDKINILFPDFENYLQVRFDPLEVTNFFGHNKVAQLLHSKCLLGVGYESKLNVASDLFLNGYDNDLRLKPTILLIKSMIKNGYLKKMILDTSL